MKIVGFYKHCWRRRWALFFLNLVAGLFAAPFLYWNCILMRIVLGAAHGTPILLGLAGLEALGGTVLFLFGAVGIGGCLSALRKILNESDHFVPKEFIRGLACCAKTSLLAGGMAGVSLEVMRLGLLDLHALMPVGLLRCLISAVLVLQFAAALPLCLLTMTCDDKTQRHPLRALQSAGEQLTRRPLRTYQLLAGTLLPLVALFIWRQPLPTFLGFLLVELLALIPILLVWQMENEQYRSGAAVIPRNPQLRFVPIKTRSVSRIGGAVTGIVFFALLDAAALLLPLILRGSAVVQVRAGLQETWEFLSRQTLLEADNGTFQDLLASSSMWPLLLAALLGSACCILVAYVCACYRFRLRGLLFAAVVLLQILPMLASYTSIEQLLRNLHLNISSLLLGVVWAVLYILLALLLYHRFARLRPLLQKNKEAHPGVRLFFYYALRKARPYILTLTALVTLGCWNDALAPFWSMRRLGAFSLSAYVWNKTPGAAAKALYAFIFLALFAALVGFLRLLALRRENHDHTRQVQQRK